MRRALGLGALLLLAGCLSPVHKAAFHNDVTGLRALRDAGADFRVGRPVCTAASSGNNDALAFLLDNGANPDEVWGGSSALWYATAHDNWDGVKILLKHGADAASAADEYAAFFKRNSPERTWPSIEAKANRLRRMAGLKTGPSAAAPARPSAAPPARRERPVAAPPRPASDVGAPSYRAAKRPHDFAVVVGIEKYSDIPEALYAEADAEAVKEHVLALGVPRRNIIHLLGSKASGNSIKKYIETWLPKNVKPESRVYFYFSGHGAPDPESGRAYLLPWDGDPSFLKNTAYPVEKLYAGLKKLKAKEVIVALDACFSGAGGRSVLAKGARPLVTRVDTGISRGQSLTTFTAARADEITSTLEEQGHGIFTYYFLKGLNGAGADASGRVTSKSLYRYLKPHVQDEARRQNRSQTPTVDYTAEIALR